MIMSEISRFKSPLTLPRVCRGSGLTKISITGGKGGVGKTSVSVNLAISLSRLGGRVLLVDGDLGLANADQMLGVSAQKTLYNVITKGSAIEDSILETDYGISLLPACSGRTEMEELTPAVRMGLLKAISDLSDKYDYAIIDTAAGIGETALTLTAAADRKLVVVTPDPTSNRDAFAVMKILSKDYGVKRAEIIANKIPSHVNGREIFARISQVVARFLPLTLGYAGSIDRDPCAANAVLERRPLMDGYPHSSAAKQIAKIGAHIVSEVNRERLIASNMCDSEEEI